MAGASGTDSVMAKIVASIFDHMECPVCMEVIEKAPVHKCENGHILCFPCHSRLYQEEDGRCPVCRDGRLLMDRHQAIEKILNSLPQKINCKHSGCDFQSWVASKVEEHEEDCKHRTVEYMEDDRTIINVPLCNFVNHWLENCTFDGSATVVRVELGKAYSFHQNVDMDEGYVDMDIALTYMGDVKVNFFIYSVRLKGRQLLWVSHDQGKKRAFQYSVDLLANAAGCGLDGLCDFCDVTKFKEAVLRYQGLCKSVDVTMSEMMEVQDCLTLPDRVIEQHKTEDDEFHVRISFEKAADTGWLA